MKLPEIPMNMRQKKGLKITLIIGIGIMGILIASNLIKIYG